MAQSWFFGRYETAITTRRVREAADWRQLRRWSRARILDPTKDPEPEFASMGISFRFGYKDWFDFSFRIGPRKPIQKTVTKEVFLPSKYHVRCHGPRGRLIEMKTDTVSLIASSCDKSITSIRCLPQPTREHGASLYGVYWIYPSSVNTNFYQILFDNSFVCFASSHALVWCAPVSHASPLRRRHTHYDKTRTRPWLKAYDYIIKKISFSGSGQSRVISVLSRYMCNNRTTSFQAMGYVYDWRICWQAILY